MFCKNTGKKAISLFAALVLVAVLTGHASAYTPPYKLMVFTDKQVYLDYSYIWTDPPTINTATTNDTTRGTFNQRVNLFVVLLDSDGNIVRGLPAANISAALKDKERWNHAGPGLENYPFYTAIPTNGNYYPNISFPVFADTDNDGIYNSTNDVTDTLNLQNMPPLTDQLNISINVTVRYNGSYYKTNVSVIFGNAGCRHTRNAGTAHGAGNHDGVVCTVCHWGYQYSLGAHGPDNSIMNNDPERWSTPSFGVGDSADWDYKLGVLKTGGNQTTWDNSNAGYCLMCHGGTTAITTTPYLIGNVLDLFSSAPAVADQNSDGFSDGNRPSCSWYQGPRNGTTGGYPVCHQPQTDSNGSTKITGSKLFKVDWTAASRQRPGQDKTHNHSSSPKTYGIPCELCHAGGGAPGTGTGGMHQVAGLPNRTSDYSSIDDQCQVCHNVTDGWLNITSNGGTAKNHSRTNQCSRCHIINNRLNSHDVPTGAYGGKWCLNCHNLTGTAPIDMKIDPSITNISNIDYTHYRLNDNSDAQNSSRICWGCHTNNSVIKNGRVNSTSLPEGEHAQGYDSPRSCTMCHNNSNASLTFGAPQTYRHTWYAPDMKTPAVAYCVSCHATDEMLIAWAESVFPPKNGNESASHYGRNRTLTFPPVGSREYCGYCHQNESTVMGPFAKPDNEIRSDHASQNTTPGCGNDMCHKPGRMHEDTLVVPDFNESNIGSTCLACHSPADYSFHNSTVTCWDCHMGNVNGSNPTWIHPIQFIQYNGNFTGAKLTSATCYDCHKSSSADSVIQFLSNKSPPRLFDQAHSNDPGNGTKWGDYWKYTPTTYNFASYYVTSGIIDPAFPFDNIRVPSNDYMELKETRTGSSNGGSFPYTKAEQEINGPPVPNWTYSSRITAGTSTITATQDGYGGNPPGSLKTVLRTSTSSGGSGTISWNYSFYYKPNSTEFAYANASVDYFINVSTGRNQTVYFRLVKPSGAAVTLASASCCAAGGNSSWVTLRNDSFSSELDEDGSAVPYRIQLYAVLSAARPNTNTYTVYFDNIRLKFHEKVWNMYEIIINTTGVPTTGSSRLGMSYQMHMEKATLMIYNRTVGDYEYLDTMDKGVFFDYVKNINTTHHVDPTGNGITGNVSVKFVDNDRSDMDEISDVMHIRYLYVFSDQGLQYPCEQCHSPNKHYVTPTIGSPEKFRAGNRYNDTDLDNSTWCQQCHWQKAANYSRMIVEFNQTRNPPENIPPEITGNKTYGNFTTSKDGKTAYVNHTGSAYTNMNDSGCFRCHGKAGDVTSSQFIHNVQIGQSGNRKCVTCHNANATNYKKVDVEAVRRGMHGSLRNASANASNTSDIIELACWACHGDGIYSDPEMHRNTNAWTCDKCHTGTTGKLNYSAPQVHEHIPPGYTIPEADITARFNNTAWACADCHNNSINATALVNDDDSDPKAARVGHYGQNSTAGKLMYDYSLPPKGNSEDCTYCHKGADMEKWGVDPLSKKNLSNKVSPTDHSAYTNSNCGGCHNYTVSQSFTFHNYTLTNGTGSAGGSDCLACHNIGGSKNNVNFSAINASMHATINSGATSTPQNVPNKPCWGCHGTKIGLYANESDQPSGEHNASFYKAPRRCYDCHVTGNLQFTKKNVTDHIPSGYSPDTDVISSSYCTACHNNSVNSGYEPDGMGITGGSIMNASVSHYGANRSANRLMSAGSNSTDCVFCHRNSTNMIKWGIIQGSLANISNKNASGGGTDHDPYTLSSDCTLCHGGYVLTAAFTFHNSALGAGIGSGPNCILCHDAGGSAGAGKLVNFTAMNDSNAIHRDLNRGAAVSDNNYNGSKKCWACHDEGTQPSGHNNSRYKVPYRCEDCHTQSGIQSGKYQGINVTEHLKAGTVSGTELFTQLAGNCYSCHNLSEMMVGTSLDPDGISGNIYGGTNGGSNSTSHYGKKRNLGTADAYCNYCHSNATTVFGFDEQNSKRIYEHTGNSTADIRNATTMECIDCHTTDPQSYRIHNSTLNTPQAGEWTAGRQDRCSPCHKTGGAGSTLKVNNSYHNTTTGNITDCSYCHNSESMKSSAPQNIHSDNLTKGGNSSFNNCYNCHQNGFASGVIFEHTNSTAANITNITMTCDKSGCHNSDRTHSGNLVIPSVSIWTSGKQDRCSPCHKSTGTGSILKVNNSYHNTSTGNITDCSYCHNSESLKSSAPQNIHSRNLTKGGTPSFNNCYNCHQNGFASGVIFEHTNSTAANITNATMTCNKSGCHNSDRTHSNALVTPPVSPWTSGKQDRCSPCHKSTGAGSTLKVNNSFHNTTTGNITDCSYCHNIDSIKASAPQNVHSRNLTKGGTPSFNDCYTCHQNGFTSKAIFEHTNSSSANITNASMTCEKSGCHNSDRTHAEELVKPYVVSWTAGANDYCAPCHNSSDSTGNATKKIYRQGHDPALRTNDNITGCASCHNASTPGGLPASFRLHDSSLTNLSGSNESACMGCHNGTSSYVGNGKLILSHMPSASQYRGNTSMSNYTCEYCHNMTGKTSMHSPGMTRSSGTCDTCHFNNTSPFRSLAKNITEISGGMVNHTYDGRDSNTCNTTMCHNASGRVKFHLSEYAAGDIAYPQDSAGNPTFPDRAIWSGDINDRGILVDCRDCHEKYNDTAPFFAPFQEANNTGVNNQEHVGKGYKLTNCYVCHTAEDNVSKSASLHNVSIEPLTGGPGCKKCHDIASVNRTLDSKLWMNVTAFNSTNSVHRSFINSTLWNGSKVFELEDTACWVCHQSDGRQPERHTDKKDEAYKAYKCADCHAAGGIAGIYQPLVYNNATKVFKHYPGSVFLNKIIFTDLVSCSMCHKKSLMANTNITGYPNPAKADDIDVSHYGTLSAILNTSNLNGCQMCHGIGGNGTFSMDYGSARKMPDAHNYMGAKPVDCESLCHNSAIDMNNVSIPVDLHNDTVGVNVGSEVCYSPGCHKPPAPPDDGGGTR